MVKAVVGDIFRSKAQTLVATVNCVGVMGKGLALEFRKRFPDMHEDYVRRCHAGEVRLGKPYLYKCARPPWVLVFPTKDHWRSLSRIEDIIRGLEHLEANVMAWGTTSLAVPPLGCGLGQLDWRVVGPTLFRHLEGLGIPVELYAPHGTPGRQLTLEFLRTEPMQEAASVSSGEGSALEPGLVALVEVLGRLEAEEYHWPVGRIAFQKLAYFATQWGLSTGLSFERGSYGPHSPQLKRKLTQLQNNGLIREERRGRMFRVRVGPTFETARNEYEEEICGAEAVVDRLHDFLARMNTREAELAATVDFAARELQATTDHQPSEAAVLRAVGDWKQRRDPPFEEVEVAVAIRHMAALGCLDVSPSEDLPIPAEAADDF